MTVRIGDTVEFNQGGRSGTGTVVVYKHEIGMYGVLVTHSRMMGYAPSLHDLRGQLAAPSGWWVQESNLTVIQGLSPLEQEVRNYCDKELNRV